MNDEGLRNSNEGISKLDIISGACDMVGMTDIPIISQGAELISAGISLSQGEYFDAALSVGSMIPIVGKGAETLKIARRTAKTIDKVSDLGKNAKSLDLAARKLDDIVADPNTPQLLTLMRKKIDDLKDGVKQVSELPKGVPQKTPPQPAKINAKAASKKKIMEVMRKTKEKGKKILDDTFDSMKELGESIKRGNEIIRKNGGTANITKSTRQMFKEIEDFPGIMKSLDNLF